MRGKLLILAISVVVTVLVLEIAARFLLRDISTTGDATSYFGQRWLAEIRPTHNVWGYRERDFAEWPESGTYRIAVIGDSYTYGQGVAEAERLTSRLETALNDGAGAFEVLNFGIGGANYEQNTASVELALDHAHPDFVLIQWLINDVDDPAFYMPRPLRLGGSAHQYLHPHSALYYIANRAWGSLQRRLGLVGESDYYVDQYATPDSPLAVRARARLEGMLRKAKERGVPVAMFLWPPALVEDYDYSRYAFIYDQVLATCEAENVPCLDLRPTFVGERAGDGLVVNRLDTHPNGRANGLAAAAVLDAFGPLWREGAEQKLGRIAAGQHQGAAISAP
jgi:lysophospholipase L1-like esterase